MFKINLLNKYTTIQCVFEDFGIKINDVNQVNDF